MKKMTIALFTAAAMGTSGFAVAQTGPDFSGRIDYTYTDLEQTDEIEGGDVREADNGNGNASSTNSKLAVSGSGDAVAGLSTFYYARINLGDANDSGDANVDYSFAGVEGDFGRVSVGVDDDLVYKFVGSRTDVYRGVAPLGNAIYASGVGFGDNPGLQYHFSQGAFSVGALVDQGETGTTNGTDNVQLGASADFGVVSLGVAYADRESIEGYDEELHFGATFDLGIASVRATLSDRTSTDTTDSDTTFVEVDNPYHIAAVVPVNDIFTATVGYGSNDAVNDDYELTDVTAMIMANLGGGVDVNAAVRNGDSGDGISAGLRYTF